MSSSSEENKLRFNPFSSIINPGFWQQLTNIKLNKLKLSQDPVDIHGTYNCSLSETLPCLASFDSNSFNEFREIGRSVVPLFGQLICTNIKQDFLNYDKREFLNLQGRKIWEAICNGEALKDPQKHLSRFGLLVYADLKKYDFFYMFAFPAINYPKQVSFISRDYDETKSNFRPVIQIFGERALRMLQEEYDKPASDRNFQRGYFIIKHYTNASTQLDEVNIFSLDRYTDALQNNQDHLDSQIYFAYSDPSGSTIYPGWPLRNFLSLIAVQFNLDRVKILRIRNGQLSTNSKYDLQQSTVFEVALELDPKYNRSLNEVSSGDIPTITGWEKNESQNLAPKKVNLSSLLDAKKLAEDAVNLNLRLMKWRLLPGLDLDKIAETKCLLLGCGTLGCNVARGLLAWGVKNISIVDNSKISYSNPVRQTLYNFDDCVSSKSGVYKAEAAKINLKKIHPSVNVNAYTFSIPMPGHHVAESVYEQTKKDVQLLEELIESHDAIFLLMDTRESRWLPTVISMSKQRLIINAAIGFESFLLQRCGFRDYDEDVSSVGQSISASNSSRQQSDTRQGASPSTQKGLSMLESNKLGCYFCNDIVAPGDSTLDRTLDQQCTVSRPGVSMMVSAMAIELLASIASSRDGPRTPAPLDFQSDQPSSEEDDYGCELGIVPHSIRGNLARYHIYMPTSPCFNKCSACSIPVIQAYRKSGFEFLHQVFDDPSYLEEIAGLKDLQNVSDNVLAFGSDDEIDDPDQEIKCK